MDDGPRHADAGWECLRRGTWAEARRHFEAARALEPSAEVLEGLAWACFWLVDIDVLLAARAEAYRRYHQRGDVAGAARAAMWLGSDNLEFAGNAPVANGWFRRAHRLLEGAPPCPEHGWLALHEGEAALLADHDLGRATTLAETAADLGRRFGSPDLEAVGMALEGLALVTEGRVEPGMALLDEAAAAALGGTALRELWAVAWCSCYVIYACERVRDIDRAAHWCREVESVSATRGIDFTWALCRAHHASVLVWRGEWRTAEDELGRAARDLERQRPPWTDEAIVRLAELRRRQGRYDEAIELFHRAESHPLAIEGRAEIALDRGEPQRARRLAEQMLRHVPPDARTERAAGLQLLARASAAVGASDVAAEALAELETLVAAVGTDPLRASCARAAGLVQAVRGEHDTACRRLEDAVTLFERSGAPYDSARARLELADALVTVGAADDAHRERRLARDVLARLGAKLPRDLPSAADGGTQRAVLTPREREVLGLVAQGMSDRRMAEILTLSEHTVHRHVSNILTKLGCSSRAAAVARGVAHGQIDASPA